MLVSSRPYNTALIVAAMYIVVPFFQSSSTQLIRNAYVLTKVYIGISLVLVGYVSGMCWVLDRYVMSSSLTAASWVNLPWRQTLVGGAWARRASGSEEPVGLGFTTGIPAFYNVCIAHASSTGFSPKNTHTRRDTQRWDLTITPPFRRSKNC